MEQDYKGRFEALLEFLNCTANDFSREIGLSSTTTIRFIIRDNRKPSSKTIQKISAAFPEVNTSWLLYGRGEMILEVPRETPEDDLTMTSQQVFKRLEDLEKSLLMESQKNNFETQKKIEDLSKKVVELEDTIDSLNVFIATKLEIERLTKNNRIEDVDK